MSFRDLLAGKWLRWVVRLAMLWGAGYLLLLVISEVFTSYVFCTTEILKTVYDLSGFDFEISETDCDALSKDASVSVLASKHGETKKTLLFKYDPIWYASMPLITPLDQRTVRISIPRVSSLFFQRDSWDGLSITYDIGVIDYPEAKPERK
jgi:hypothetical protein